MSDVAFTHINNEDGREALDVHENKKRKKKKCLYPLFNHSASLCWFWLNLKCIIFTAIKSIIMQHFASF